MPEPGQDHQVDNSINNRQRQDIDPDKLISVSVSIGAAPNAGGSIPHLALFDRLRRSNWKPTQSGGKQVTPDYLLIIMQESNALCVSAIVASGGSQQRIWTGDMAYSCGAQLYHSKELFGGYNAPLRCAWLEADHSNGILAKGLSLHLQRMTFHPEIMADSLVARFNPPLEYNSQGGIKSPNRGINRRTKAYPDGTFKKKRANEVLPHNVTASSDAHSARALCDHPMLLGPDFVDIPEGLFCDMETGKVWPLCEGSSSKTCFDLHSRETRYSFNATLGRAKSASPTKQYKSYEW
ncbi:uncharacterized protein BDV14DRAFT_193942 [Aspergillus stella-maris]|uniref:uncharacterized protein n=1 Tax=Aspergillus stella-maris TaxID=1810926 RepID=UPI003CCDDAF4